VTKLLQLQTAVEHDDSNKCAQSPSWQLNAAAVSTDANVRTAQMRARVDRNNCDNNITSNKTKLNTNPSAPERHGRTHNDVMVDGSFAAASGSTVTTTNNIK